ncbi:hypothetical protein ARMGADRAFT_1067603 [Armillaria gallica]|uniref:Uncharacterized protein n=1 Tax=Armillaria gallica TaxID=47427 RepID=A0A2H3CLH0_ARMGA|nr:hypothetical protein ARMGADRAFT_1067603 [Armillaria gallica]
MEYNHRSLAATLLGDETLLFYIRADCSMEEMENLAEIVQITMDITQSFPDGFQTLMQALGRITGEEDREDMADRCLSEQRQREALHSRLRRHVSYHVSTWEAEPSHNRSSNALEEKDLTSNRRIDIPPEAADKGASSHEGSTVVRWMFSIPKLGDDNLDELEGQLDVAGIHRRETGDGVYVDRSKLCRTLF